MPDQLPADCLNGIFELLEDDKNTLHSCLFVNRLWCDSSVRILWKNVFSLRMLHTLIACLPDESKVFLRSNEIFISTPPPLFNYVSFCKVIPVDDIYKKIKLTFENRQIIINSNTRNHKADLVTQELLKMVMKQTSLEKLSYYLDSCKRVPNDIAFVHFPGAKDCLTKLSELGCCSHIHSEFFIQLSQICHNIQSLNIEFEIDVSSGLKDLISSQNNLKHLLLHSYDRSNWVEIIPSLMKHSNTLIKLEIKGEISGSLSFITKFPNLQELTLSLKYKLAFEDFSEFQTAIFPNLQILRFPHECPDVEILIEFLLNNGQNLKEFYARNCDYSLNLVIAEFCPNLKSLYTLFFCDEIDILKLIFNNCQKLESIRVWCGDEYLEEKELLETVAQYSPENFHILKIHNDDRSELLSTDLESFFISWKSRIPQRSLSFVLGWVDMERTEVTEVIEKYENLGVIEKSGNRIERLCRI